MAQLWGGCLGTDWPHFPGFWTVEVPQLVARFNTFFAWDCSPTEIDYRKKVGTLILTSQIWRTYFLQVVVVVTQSLAFVFLIHSSEGMVPSRRPVGVQHV